MSDYELNVPVDVRVCPTCGMSIWAGGEIEVPGDPNVDEIITAVQMEIAKRTEEAIIEHYMVYHRFRYWLWLKLGWKRVLGC
jgi:hypothetical protein